MDAIETIDPTNITGYAAEDRYLASRYTQGARRVYDFELPLVAIPQLFPVPDPDAPTLGNRRVKPGHAKNFSKYVRENESWVAPALLMRAADIFSFEAKSTISGVSFGVLGVPRSARRDIRIIDGQHRILGLAIAVDDIGREMDEARSHLDAARRDNSPEQIAHFTKQIKKLEKQRDRMAREFMAVQVHIETNRNQFEQMFFDVADNALGITQAVKVRFDSRKVMNRTLDAAMKHALLRERVDIEQDRISGSNPNLLGARHVVDIVRTVNVGIAGRVSRRQESELEEGSLVQRFNEFMDVMLEAFPDLAAVADGRRTPEELRKQSLLGSSSMLRVLAGVYYQLITQGYTDDDVAPFFGRLAPFMTAPIAKGSPWTTIRNKVLLEGAMAPTARKQDLQYLADEISEWIEAGKRPGWLGASAA